MPCFFHLVVGSGSPRDRDQLHSNSNSVKYRQSQFSGQSSDKRNKGIALLGFTENKGQVCDQHFRSRSDVLFSGTDGRFVYHLKNGGVSYQLNRVDSWIRRYDPAHSSNADEKETYSNSFIPDQTTVYRLDIDWLDTRKGAEIYRLGERDGTSNYYMTHCPTGVLGVKTYSEVIYRSIYEGIDLRWYEKNGQLEYDFVVSPGADHRKISMRVSGATSIRIDSKGNIVFATPLGEISEQSPVVMQEGRMLTSHWILNGNQVSFSIKGVDPGKPYTIDPVVRGWSTYYGDGAACEGEIATDKFGNVYMTGGAIAAAGTGVATTGSHQTVFAGGNGGDAFVVKFNAAGVRQWATYYGGSEDDFGYCCTTDGTGAVYFCGMTWSLNAISSPGSHQPQFGGMFDAFLVKLNDEGVRQWATYYGDTGGDWARSCKTDINGDVYMAGHTNSAAAISTAGSHQQIYGGGVNQLLDAFLVKFSSDGVRQWATYYGGADRDIGFSCATDPFGNIYLAGESFSPTGSGIATPGSHQTQLAGGIYHGDAFLVKFNGNGVRQWGTYYGGFADEKFYSGSALTTDASGNVYMAATSWSPTDIATPGSHQPTIGGSDDAFLVKFNPSGVRQWATYYGDIDDDYGSSCAVDMNGNVYLAGIGNETLPGSGIFVTPGVFQSTYGGYWDAFLVKFSSAGVRQWGTFFGGYGDEDGRSCALGTNGDIFISGNTPTDTGLTTPGSHQPVFSPNSFLSNAYLVKLSESNLTDLENRGLAHEVSIHPNPVSDRLHISVDARFNGYDFQLLDLHGRIVCQGRLTATSFAISMADLPAGLYLFRLEGDSVRTWKVIKADLR